MKYISASSPEQHQGDTANIHFRIRATLNLPAHLHFASAGKPADRASLVRNAMVYKSILRYLLRIATEDQLCDATNDATYLNAGNIK